jgi:hypothetical protein
MKTALRSLRLFVAAAVILSLAAFVLATPASATHGQPGKQLPFRLMYAGPVTLELAPGYPEERSTFDGRCSIPSDWVSSYILTGAATHLGWASSGGSHCSRLDRETGEILYEDGMFTARAANGDTLVLTYGNGYYSPAGWYTDEWMIASGTGRLAGATGAGTDIGTADQTATGWTMAGRFDGWIAYDMSQGSGP